MFKKAETTGSQFISLATFVFIIYLIMYCDACMHCMNLLQGWHSMYYVPEQAGSGQNYSTHL